MANKKPTHQLIVDGYVWMSGSKSECESSEQMFLHSPDPRYAGSKTKVVKIPS